MKYALKDKPEGDGFAAHSKTYTHFGFLVDDSERMRLWENRLGSVGVI